MALQGSIFIVICIQFKSVKKLSSLGDVDKRTETFSTT